MKTKANQKQQNRFVYIITAPIRALCKARDLYVKSMLDCANANAVGLQGTAQTVSLPRSFSLASSHEDRDDYLELVRAASARSAGSRDDVVTNNKRETSRMVRAGPQRSISFGMGRIDEEGAINHFGEDMKIGNNNNNNESKYRRSKSDVMPTTSI